MLARRPTNTVEPVYNKQPSNIPGMTYIGLKVRMPVNAATPPHRHGGAAVTATIIKGTMINQMECGDPDDDGKAKIYKAGDSWYEPPGCHHVRAENAGDEELEFIANFVIETSKLEKYGPQAALVQIDAAVDAGEAEKVE